MEAARTTDENHPGLDPQHWSPWKGSESTRTWDEIVEISKTKDVDRFSRHPDVRDAYVAHRDYIMERYNNVDDYMREKILRWKVEPDSATGKLKALLQDTSDPPPPPVLIPNDFPYACAQGIHHYLLWSPVRVDEQQAHVILERDLGPDHEWVIMENPPHRRTVPGIFHFHIFYRKTQSTM
ncbi:hypothetical protein SeMB42_g01138 [Synchytrium endobioticum]|uniref:Uncharacterized protein n=1 Tax=Synchytrium endobioticum TaxID=286115 RepID=A0A507DMK3_9FUNG|nr:hypothetical protein SeLEV6574_g03566 [Synchytrium endobioticum]TPX52823.1 hypothetical protein SeMB42_g01138 [Synchytrium endobioticum]